MICARGIPRVGSTVVVSPAAAAGSGVGAAGSGVGAAVRVSLLKPASVGRPEKKSPVARSRAVSIAVSLCWGVAVSTAGGLGSRLKPAKHSRQSAAGPWA